MFSSGVYFSQNYYLFPHDSCNGLDLSVRNILVSCIQKIFPYNALYFALGKRSCICPSSPLWDTCFLLHNYFWTLCFLFDTLCSITSMWENLWPPKVLNWIHFQFIDTCQYKLFHLEHVTFFSSLDEGISQTITLQGLFLSVFILLNKSDSGLSETVTYNPKRISLKSLAALSVHLFLVDSVFFHPCEIKSYKILYFLLIWEILNFLFPLLLFYFFVNQDNCPEWFVTMKSLSVIWGSSSLLSVMSMKNFKSRKLYSFHQTSIYLKVVAFLPITFLQGKFFLKIVYTCDRICAWKVLLISYKLSSQSLLSLIRKVKVTHTISLFWWFKHMLVGTGYPSIKFWWSVILCQANALLNLFRKV